MYFFNNEPLPSWDEEALFVVERTFNEEEKVKFEEEEFPKRKWATCYFEKIGERWVLKRKGTLSELVIFYLTRGGFTPKEVLDSMRTHEILKACEKTRYEGDLKLTDESFDWLKEKFDAKIQMKNKETDKVEESCSMEAFFGATSAVIRDFMKKPLKQE